MGRKKIALVNQRYGLEVNGGSEYYTRLIAEHLTEHYQVEVLTSKALSYEKWTNYYSSNEETINGVIVRRFPVRQERNQMIMDWLGKLITRYHLNQKWICNAWVKAQGPQLPEMVHFIRAHREEYAAILFVTYLYYPTVFGLPEAKERAIFIPTAHDEPYIHFKSHADLFGMPKAFIYLTEEEKTLVNGLFHNERIPSVVAGVGVDVPQNINPAVFRKKYGIEGEYLIYTGRVDQGKGCAELFDYFLKHQKEGDPTTLVIMGQQFMEIPKSSQIRYLGFVSEEDKYNGLAGANALWLPSPFESLSISVLEAMALGIPVLVNGKCEVLKGHCEKSGGGLYYTDYESCRDALQVLLKQPEERKRMGAKAEAYIKDRYLWPQIIQQIENLIEEVDTI